METNFMDLAPWVAIAITLILSILVPVFTQIANNSHQRKMQKQKFVYEQKQKEIEAFEEFLLNVGGTVTTARYSQTDAINKAGASLHKLYIYAPEEWHPDMDSLTVYINKFEWEKAMPIMQRLSHLVAEELNKITNLK